MCITAALCCAAPVLAQNVVQLENLRAGSSDWVRLQTADNHEIEGYASATSVNRGDTIRLYVSTPDPTYTINIYRTGWYNGVGARKVAGPIVRTGTLQTTPSPDPTTGIIECNWSDPYTVTTSNPNDATDWPSGVYVAKLTSGTTNKESYIVFVVRDDARASTHYFQASVTTYQAYNEWGGKSLYAFNSSGGVPATKVSFNRPYLHGGGTGEYLLRWEYNMVRFLEREGYDVSYCTDIDTHRRGALIKNHRDFLVVGHDEYWSDEMRTSVTSARDVGVNLGFFSANDCYWQIRLAPSALNNDLDRTIIAYKEAYAQDPFYTDGNPSNDHLVTNAWRSAPVNNSEDALIGVMYVADPVDTDIVIDDVTSAPWVFENTGLVTGSKLTGLLGYEVDKIQSRSPVPITRLGHSPFTTNKTNGQPNVSDFSDMTLYTAQSGALVFATGSIQFAYGLDNWNSAPTGDRTSEAARQLTRNILKKFAGTAASNDCQFALSPTSSSTGAKSGGSSFTVTTFCSWTATPDVNWITVTPPASGTASAQVVFTFTANTTTASRVGHIQVGDRVYTLTQAKPCSYETSPPSFQFGANGGTGSVSITTDSTCFWSSSVSSSYPWITITGGASGNGNGTTTFTVASFAGQGSRVGSLAVAGNSISVTQTVAPFAPQVEAHATSGTQVAVSWNAPPFAASYEVERRSAGGSFTVVATPTTNSFTDNSVTAGSSYLYRVHALNAGGSSPDSAPDLATTVMFTDDPLVPGVTTIKAVHLQELRTAVTAVATLAGTPVPSFTDSASPGVMIRAVHINELRSLLDSARNSLGLFTGGYTDTPVTAGIPVKAVHFQEIRDRVR